jgi:hypothetical protein
MYTQRCRRMPRNQTRDSRRENSGYNANLLMMNLIPWAWEKWKSYVEIGIAAWIVVKAPRLLFWLNRLFA